MTLGNSSLTMYIDGRARTVPPSSQAIGYSLDKTHGASRWPQANCRPCA